MKIVFFGNKSRGISCLQILIKTKHKIALTVAHPDATKTCSSGGSFKEYAINNGYQVEQPERVNDPAFLDRIASLAPDLLVLCGYGQILKEEIISTAKLGAVNCHSGNLPQYRGSSPINWAIINGEKSLGLSIISVDLGIDTGDILANKEIPILSSDTAATLQKKADGLFPDMLKEVIDGIAENSLAPINQSDSGAGYYCLRSEEDGLIMWELMDSSTVLRLIKALVFPFPGAFTFFKGQKCRIDQAEQISPKMIGIPGKIMKSDRDGVVVMCQDRCIRITRYQYEEAQCSLRLHKGEYFRTLRSLILEKDI